MPVYNDASLVVPAIRSLQSQTVRDFELIVSDNASTDTTGDVCRALAEKDPRIRYHRQPVNGGQAANFEFTLSKARGEYFAWVCSDDRWDERFLERLIGAIEASSGAIGAFGPYAMTEPTGEIAEVRFFDYSGGNAVSRLYSMCRTWDDGHEYGLFRRSMLDGLTFPRWWGPNRPSPYEISYPVLFFILARGNVVSVDGAPLLLKRKRGGGFHYQAGGASRGRWFLFKSLLNLNALVASLVWTYRGSRSFVVAACVAPALSLQILRQAVAPVPALVRYPPGGR
jgi:glycosyltransferase involved in cell wall biosynthesis